MQSISSIIRGHGERFGPLPAITYPDGVVSWEEFDKRANQRARQLVSLGVKKDDLVAVMLPNGCAFHEAVAAIWRAGATPLLLPSKLPGREANELLQLAAPACVIGEVASDQNIPVISARSSLDGYSDEAVDDVGARHWKAVASGGSSGRPKIIVDKTPAFVDMARPPFAGLGFREGGVMLNPGPLYHNLPFLFTSYAVIAGSQVVGMSRFDPEECLRLIELHKVEVISLVPTMMQRIWTLPEGVRNAYDVSSLQYVWHMSAPCPHWVKRGWIEWLGAEKVFEVYGGTEAGGCAISGPEWLHKPGSVGRPMIPGSLRILRDDGSEAAAGEVGEVYFSAEARKKFEYIGAEAKADRSGGYSIGDLGYIDDDGYLFLADRRSDLILRGAANIYPAEVEAVLDEHPSIATSTVVGLPGGDLGERVHAIIQLRAGETLDLTSIASHVAERLAKYKWPASYELSEQALRDDAGKVRRSALKAERLDWLEKGRAFELSPSE